MNSRRKLIDVTGVDMCTTGRHYLMEINRVKWHTKSSGNQEMRKCVLGMDGC